MYKRQITREARKQHTIISYVSKERLDQLSETHHHQGVIAIAAAYDYATVDDILAKAREKGEAPFVFLLDGIEDPHNLGAIIRTCLLYTSLFDNLVIYICKVGNIIHIVSLIFKITRRKDEFVPLEEGKVRMYVCGPTVYNYIHIGNARPMIVFDAVRRYFEYKGYDEMCIRDSFQGSGTYTGCDHLLYR